MALQTPETVEEGEEVNETEEGEGLQGLGTCQTEASLRRDGRKTNLPTVHGLLLGHSKSTWLPLT